MNFPSVWQKNHNFHFLHAQVCEMTSHRSFQRTETLNGNCFLHNQITFTSLPVDILKFCQQNKLDELHRNQACLNLCVFKNTDLTCTSGNILCIPTCMHKHTHTHTHVRDEFSSTSYACAQFENQSSRIQRKEWDPCVKITASALTCY